MPMYLLTRNVSPGATVRGGVRHAIVQAESNADARALANGYYSNDPANFWNSTDTTVLALQAPNVPSNWDGVTMRVRIYDTDGALVVDVSATGSGGATPATIAASLVTALNATALIAGAAYGSDILTIAETTDGIGDHTVVIECFPSTTFGGDATTAIEGVFSGGSLVHEGAAGDALEIEFVPASAIPAVIAVIAS